MADRLTQRRPGPISNMTGITAYTRTHNVRAGVVGVGIQETDRGMAVATFRVGDRVYTGRDVIFSWRLANRHSAVVATCASPANIRMIKAAVRIKLQKCDGIVAAITFGFGWLMKLGFTDCSNAIVTLAAISNNFLMVCKRDNVESLWSMTGLARVTGGNVIRRLAWNSTEVIVMTIHTI